MKIIGTDHLTNEQVKHELSKGGKFVIYQYAVSLLVVSFKRSSDIYFVTSDRPFTGPRLGYTLLSLIAGWWGVPWVRSSLSKASGRTYRADAMSRPRSSRTLLALSDP